ncbi:MAG: murein transglycosylase domain-containing protein [Bacteroidota bacterium]|jgi:membrane-bound lytic murein transglycosylase C
MNNSSPIEKYLCLLLLLLCVPARQTAYAQANDEKTEFEKFKKAQAQGVRDQSAAFQQYKETVTKQYDEYVKEQERLFKEYTGRIEKLWGTKKLQVSMKKEYVSYDSSFASRRSIDFEKGTARVEVLVTERQAQDRAFVNDALRNQVEKIVTSKGGEDPLEKKTNTAPEPKPLLDGQIRTTAGAPVTETNAARFADQAVQSFSVKQQTVVGADGVKRVVIGVQLPLVPDHLKKRASEFRSRVRTEAVRFAIDPSLVFAVMHTESYFNPMARSSVPAYGLMQLVPKSGARDAYLFVNKRDSLVSGEYLFIPGNNIELGTAYLAKLLTVDFASIRDPKSRMYCAIAAYNTGPGNVAKCFSGKRNVKSAVPKINAMSSDEVFDHLKKNLPFAETRNYISTVSSRMGLYNEWSTDH